MHQIPQLDNKGLRNFAFTTGTAIALIFGIFLPWLFDRSYPYWPWAILAILAVWGILAPASLAGIYRGWMKFALLLSKITTPIILGTVFFLVIFPASIIFRILRNDPMSRKFEDKAQSYRVKSDKPQSTSLENPF